MKGIQNTVTSNFSSVVSNNRRFCVPKFQRDYSWENEQWDDLWQDIEAMIKEDDEHYMGYLVLQTKDDKLFYIIDGQQRFTTIILLILAAIKSIKKLVEQGVEADDNQRRIENLKSMFIGKEDPVTLEYDNLLVLNRNNNPYYKDYIVKMGGLRARNLKSTEKLMKKCFEFFEQRLNGKFQSGKEYASYIQRVVDNLYFTQIVVNDEMNAFRVFETLNARGVQLSSSDLLKNYLFSLVDRDNMHESYIETLEYKWTRLTDNIKAEKLPEFLRYYWNISHRAIRSNALFKTIRSEIKTDKQVFSLMDDMMRYSDIYMALMDENDELWTDEEEKECIKLLKVFRLKQPFSLLMSAKMRLSKKDFIRLLKHIINLCFRYNVICDKNPNDQEIPFNNLAISINKGGTLDFSILSSIVIEDTEFENIFKEKSFPYNTRNMQIVRYILGKIEHFKGSTLRVTLDDDNATVEHILPQNFDESWPIDESKASRLIYRLGNTCLLEKKLNRSIQNANFAEKKAIYATSSYYYAKKIAEDINDWNESEIIKIQKGMARAACSIWSLNP